MEIKTSVRNYILQNFLFTDDTSKLDDGESFIDKGIIDSTGILELIMFVETEFQMQVADVDMTMENFDSVDRIARFIAEKIATTDRQSI